MACAIFLSVFDWNWGRDFVFVGAGNYLQQLRSGPFWRIMANTACFAVGAVTIEFMLGLALAVSVNGIAWGTRVARTVLILPLMISGIVVSLTAKILLDPMLGLVNYILQQIGLPAMPFFGSTQSAMLTIIAVDTWWQTGFVFIVLLAGLQSLPREPYESADVDGATPWQQFRYITLPMLKPVLFVVLIFRTIDCLKVFAIVFGTTNGGPELATEVAQTYAYRTAFKVLEIGDAMTITVMFSAVILALSLLYIRFGEWNRSTTP
ncbi:MAG: hypothetical protein AMXMBFR84_49240 [Candidatus Hydrogenedentota bacterium]